MMDREPRKVLHLIESGGLYGAEQVILNLSLEMLKEAQFVPVIGCIVSSLDERCELYDKARSMGIGTIRLVIQNSRFFLHVPIVAFKIKRHGIRIIHSHGYKPSVTGFIMSLFTGIPIMATCHLWFPGVSPPLRYRIMTKLELLFYRFFPCVVAVSSKIKDQLISHGINERRVSLVTNGIGLDFPISSDNSWTIKLRSDLDIDDDSIVIINVARLSEQKAQSNLVDATEILNKRGLKTHLVIAGEGELRGPLESLIKQRALTSYVHLLGFRSDINELLTMADFFVLPSLDEGLPMSLLEAMAARKPVIATSVGQIPRIIENGKEGLLVPPNDITALVDTIKWLAEHKEAAMVLAENAHLKVRRELSASSMFAQYNLIYRHLCCI